MKYDIKIGLISCFWRPTVQFISNLLQYTFLRFVLFFQAILKTLIKLGSGVFRMAWN